MEWKCVAQDLSEVTADWLIVPLWQGELLPPAVARLDGQLGGLLVRLLERKDFSGKAGEVTPLLHCPGGQAKRLLLVGLGEKAKASRRGLYLAASAASRAVSTKEVGTLALALPEPFGDVSAVQSAQILSVGLSQGCVSPGLRKSAPDRFLPRDIQLVVPATVPLAEIRDAVGTAAVLAEGVALTRELVNTPPCDLYPESFAARAHDVALAAGLQCEVFDERRLVEERMGALLGVAQGSARPPRLVLLRYNGAPGGRTLGLVGKGVTFDSGGLSLKPSDSMLDMKCDMAGAATVLGAMQSVARLKLPVNVLGVLPLVENMPGGKAFKLGDVLRARNGKTIEIHNTDAEGRLILADALAYAVEQGVAHLVDLATLTGACMVALGTEVTGLMTNNDAWAEHLRNAAQRTGELVWPLPMFPHYGELIKSNVADMKNTGGTRWGGAITAAKLLEEFVGTVPWVHLDIAGPAWAESENASRAAGGTGVLVRTLVELAAGYEQVP